VKLRGPFLFALALGMPQIADAQTDDLLPDPALIAQAVAGKDAVALAAMVGPAIEMTGPDFNNLGGYKMAFEAIERLEGCAASYDSDPSKRKFGMTIGFDCPQPEGFVVGQDCATEDWSLYVTRRMKSEAARVGVPFVAVLGPKRSNEGACFRAPMAPPRAVPLKEGED
jgi:hypothetical protein